MVNIRSNIFLQILILIHKFGNYSILIFFSPSLDTWLQFFNIFMQIKSFESSFFVFTFFCSLNSYSLKVFYHLIGVFTGTFSHFCNISYRFSLHSFNLLNCLFFISRKLHLKVFKPFFKIIEHPVFFF